MHEIDLNFIFHRMRQGWRTPAVLSVLAVLFTIFTLWGAKPVYHVEMLVLPAPTAQPETGMGTVGSLLGIALGAQTSNDYTRYQKLIASPAVAQRMQDRYGMLQIVFADQWDKQNRRWVAPSTLRSALFGWLFNLAHVPIWSPPDATALASYIENNVDVLPSPTSDIVHVSMENRDAAFARRFLLAMHTEANNLLRDQVGSRARQQVAYLQAKLAQTSVTDYRATLLALLSTEEKTLMLTQTDASYAAEIVSPPVASPLPVSPRPLRAMLVALLVGILVGFAMVIFLGPDWWRSAWARLVPGSGRSRDAAPAVPRT